MFNITLLKSAPFILIPLKSWCLKETWAEARNVAAFAAASSLLLSCLNDFTILNNISSLQRDAVLVSK
jgi:hypothetical protein